MKTLILFSLMFFSSCEAKSDLNMLQGDVYIYEASPKIYGQSVIGFVVVQDTVVKQILSYKIYFSDKKGIVKVKKGGYPSGRTYVCKKDTEGNILIEGLNIQAYTKESYVKHRFNKDTLYTMLHADFLTFSNQQKVEILERYTE